MYCEIHRLPELFVRWFFWKCGLDEFFHKNKLSNRHDLTTEDIQEITRKYVRPEDLTLVVLGDKAIVENWYMKPFHNRRM